MLNVCEILNISITNGRKHKFKGGNIHLSSFLLNKKNHNPKYKHNFLTLKSDLEATQMTPLDPKA